MTEPVVGLGQWTTGGGPERLLDCGHVGVFAGVCQFQGCATRLCPECVATCESCGRVLCRAHQVWLDQGHRVFCPVDTRGYLGRKLALRLFGRD